MRFTGVCGTCPSIAVTYAGLVRTTLLDVPGVHRVVADQVHASPRSLNRIAKMLSATLVDDPCRATWLAADLCRSVGEPRAPIGHPVDDVFAAPGDRQRSLQFAAVEHRYRHCGDAKCHVLIGQRRASCAASRDIGLQLRTSGQAVVGDRFEWGIREVRLDILATKCKGDATNPAEVQRRLPPGRSTRML